MEFLSEGMCDMLHLVSPMIWFICAQGVNLERQKTVETICLSSDCSKCTITRA